MAGTPASSVPSSGAATVLAYVEYTASVVVNGINFAGANAIVTAGAIVYAGVAICIEFYSPVIEAGATAGASMSVVLCDGATDIGIIAGVTSPAAQVTDSTCYVRRYLTPTAASHTYNVKAFRSVANCLVAAGLGGAGNYQPGFIRITTA